MTQNSLVVALVGAAFITLLIVLHLPVAPLPLTYSYLQLSFPEWVSHNNYTSLNSPYVSISIMPHILSPYLYLTSITKSSVPHRLCSPWTNSYSAPTNDTIISDSTKSIVEIYKVPVKDILSPSLSPRNTNTTLEHCFMMDDLIHLYSVSKHSSHSSHDQDPVISFINYRLSDESVEFHLNQLHFQQDNVITSSTAPLPGNLWFNKFSTNLSKNIVYSRDKDPYAFRILSSTSSTASIKGPKLDKSKYGTSLTTLELFAPINQWNILDIRYKAKGDTSFIFYVLIHHKNGNDDWNTLTLYKVFEDYSDSSDSEYASLNPSDEFYFLSSPVVGMSH